MDGFERALTLGADLVDALTGPVGHGVLRWFLVVMFVVAGVAKVRRPMLAAMAIVDFGIVRRPDRALGTALGGGELLVAALIAVPATTEAGLAVAAALLWVFVAVIARSLATKREVACFCLGDPDSRISKWSGLRTGALAALVTLQLGAARPEVTAPETNGVLLVVTACSLFATALLLGRVPRLVRWNSGTVRIVEEEPA